MKHEVYSQLDEYCRERSSRYVGIFASRDRGWIGMATIGTSTKLLRSKPCPKLILKLWKLV